MRRLVQFIHDLALIPSLWRSAVAAERHRRYLGRPEVAAAWEDAVIASMPPDRRAAARATAPSGRWPARGKPSGGHASTVEIEKAPSAEQSLRQSLIVEEQHRSEERSRQQ